MAYEARCEQCGQTFRATSKEEAANELQQHNRERHGMETPREKVEEKVHQTA